MNKIYALAAFCLLISSCTKDNDGDNNDINMCEGVTAPSPTCTTPIVSSGSTVYLKAGTIANVSGYQWSGPGGFTSTVENPVITNFTAAKAGTYALKATLSTGCTTPSGVVDVTVIPCSPTNNTMNGNGILPVAFTYVHGLYSSSSGSYNISASGSQGSLNLSFIGITQPTAGIYPLVSSYAWPVNGEVQVSMNVSSAFWTMGTNDASQVYISVNAGKITGTFCSVSMSNSSFGTTAVVSSKFTEN